MENTLHKVYGHIEDGDLQSAIDVLEFLLSVNSADVEAWEAYMQICSSCEELDFLCERVLQVVGINRIDRESILDYYYFLRQKLTSRDLFIESQKSVTLELVDQFNLTLNDQSNDYVKFKYGPAWFLRKAIVVPYVVLLMIGLNLLSVRNNFGYWILMVLALSTTISIWKEKIPFDESGRKFFIRQQRTRKYEDIKVNVIRNY